MTDLVFLLIWGAGVCFVFALEPLWKRIYEWHHRHRDIETPWNRERLGK